MITFFTFSFLSFSNSSFSPILFANCFLTTITTFTFCPFILSHIPNKLHRQNQSQPPPSFIPDLNYLLSTSPPWHHNQQCEPLSSSNREANLRHLLLSISSFSISLNHRHRGGLKGMRKLQDLSLFLRRSKQKLIIITFKIWSQASSAEFCLILVSRSIRYAFEIC